MMEFNEIASKDEFVDSWSDNTKDKVASAYLTILRKVGMLDNSNHLNAISCSNFLLPGKRTTMVFGSLSFATLRN